MELSSEQKDYIGNFVSDFIRANLKVWIAENASVPVNNQQEMEIRERIIRVEESLDKHIELTKQGFDEMNKRFELLTGQMDKRFGDMDKRFELLAGQMDKRFEQADRRFEQVDKRFSQMFAYFTTGIVILGVLITVFQFLS